MTRKGKALVIETVEKKTGGGGAGSFVTEKEPSGKRAERENEESNAIFA